MKLLYVPWRNAYAKDAGRTKQPKTAAEECVFCTLSEKNDDEKNLVLKRAKHSFVMINKYPYNAGHLLVVPYQHTAELHDLPQEARTELMELTTQCSTIVKTTLDAHGINIGMNLGKIAGAGIPSHLHQHILPRWLGDTNFLPALSGTKTISFDLHQIYDQLKPAFDTL